MKWSDLLLAIPNRIGGQITDKTTSALLAALLDIQDEQIVLLKNLNLSVQRLIEGPFNSGRIHLEQAMRPHRTREEQVELIKSARSKFMDALSVEQDLVRISLTSLHLALCWLMLNSEQDAREWAEKAHEAAIKAAKAIQEKAQSHYGPTENDNFNVVSIIGSFLATSILIGFVGLHYWDKGAVKKKAEVMQRALSQMENLTPYINALADIRVHLGEPSVAVPRHKLVHYKSETGNIERITYDEDTM